MKRLVQNFLLVVIPAVIWLELMGLVSATLVPKLYGSPGLVAAIEAIDVPRFAQFTATVRSTTLGWDHIPDWIGPSEDCEGGKHVATYDRARARVFKDYDASAVTAILVGDSYTHGDEVGDEETIAAHLFRQDRIMAANLGVGGYSPIQAVLKAKERYADYPRAQVIVLGLIYDHPRRNVNGYVPVLGFLDDDQSVFGLRPYLRGETIYHLQPETFAELPAFKARALASLESDFWARPLAKFPYSVSLLRALGSNSGVSRIKATTYKMFDRQYEADYRDERLTAPLFAVVRDFFLWAQEKGIKPVAIFVPQNGRDRTSASLWIRDFAPRLPMNGVVVDARMDGADWDRFNQRPDLVCHPGSYGYATIAAAYAAALKPLLRSAAPHN